MPARTARCPECDARVPAPEDGRRWRCPRCRVRFEPDDRDVRDDLPARNPGGSSVVLPLVIVLGAVLFVGGLAAVGVAVWVWRKPAADNGPPAAAPAPVAAAEPARPDAPRNVVDRVKQATVYVRVTLGNGQQGSGSGFLAGRPGYVLTNAHVVGYGPKVLTPTREIEAVLFSGTKDERRLNATLFGVDPENDLALLQIDPAGLPDPLPFGSAEGLKETEEVIIYGFPFGEMLGRNISVNKSSVSSLRRDRGEQVAIVQLSGGMNPGNSGGPVTNAAGEVVGVCVAGLRDAPSINFAIPAEVGSRFVAEQLRVGGRIDSGRLTPAVAAGPPPVGVPPIGPPPVGPPPVGPRPVVPRPGIGRPGFPQPAVAALPPPAAPTAFRPPPLPADFVETTVPVAGVVDETVIGGDGRYLVFRLAGKRALAVFDVTTRQVVKELPTADEKAVYAIGLTHVFVLSPGQRKIQRWNLATLEKEDPLPWPDGVDTGDVQHACMGRASTGPLFIHQGRLKETVVYVPETGRLTPIPWMHWSRTNAYGPNVMHAFPDGSALVGWGGGWAGCDVAAVANGAAATVQPKIEFSGFDDRTTALPTADNRLILTGWAVVNRRFEATKMDGRLKDAVVIPALEPGFFLAVAKPVRAKVGASRPVQGGLDVYAEDRSYLFAIPEATELRIDPLAWYKRVFFYPSAGLLITLNQQKDALILRRVDVRERLATSGENYLAVVSRPPAVRRGTVFDYALDMRSSKGGARAKLTSGPPGLTVSPDGRVRWSVPAAGNLRGPEVTVELTDASGRELTHTFLITVTD